MVDNNKAVWWFGDYEDVPTLSVKLGNGHGVSVTFSTVGDPPEITMRGPSGGYRLLKDDQVDAFKAWLAAQASAVKAG
jgi:hypothetical protein